MSALEYGYRYDTENGGAVVRVQCAHGYGVTDSCPACDAAQEVRHAADPVLFMGPSKRMWARCRECGLHQSAKVHKPVPPPRKPRRARNTNRQGANFELQVMHDLEPHGFTCLRSSGSRGKVDVVAVSTDMNILGARTRQGDHLLFVQCKITDPVIPPEERRALMRMAVCANALPVVAHRVDGRVHYRRLTGTGPKDWVYWWPTWCTCGKPDCPRTRS